MRTPAIFDIETGPLEKSYLDMIAPEFEPPANLKDPEKIKAAIEEKRNKYYENAALSPLTGRVLAIGLIVDGEFVVLGDGQSEEKALNAFWTLLRQELTHQFIGFNISGFDLPFMVKRSMKYGLPLPTVFFNGRPSRQFIDLLQVWQCGDRSDNISLGRLSMFLGAGEKSGSGKDFAGLWESDRPKALDYLRNDLELTLNCAKKMGVMPAMENVPPNPVTTTNEAKPETGHDDVKAKEVLQEVGGKPDQGPETVQGKKEEQTPAVPRTELMTVLDAGGVPYELFSNYINVNGVDRQLGFDCNGIPIEKWPEDKCKLLLTERKQTIERAIKRFGKK